MIMSNFPEDCARLMSNVTTREVKIDKLPEDVPLFGFESWTEGMYRYNYQLNSN